VKSLLFTFFLFIFISLQGQSFFVQVQPEAGFSSYTRGIFDFDPVASFQVTFSGGLHLSERSVLKLGLGFQKAGAKNKIYLMTGGLPTAGVVNYPAFFIKVPVDYSIRLGRRGIITLDLGTYYNRNITTMVETWTGPFDDTPFNGDLSRDDFGVRIRPAIAVPFKPGYILSLGILQEFGLRSILIDTHHYNTYLSGGLRIYL
jgi:hypothetical protein